MSFWVPLIYGSVIYHRFRKEKKSYKQVDDPHAMKLDTSYQPSSYAQQPYNDESYESRYKGAANSDLESGTRGVGATGRRLSYNHERDNRFDAYRQSRGASPPEQQPLSPANPTVPQSHVELHDAEVHEMNSRSELR